MVGAGKKLDHQTKLVQEIGINQNFLGMLVHPAGIRERQLEEIIRIATGANLVETLKVAVGLGEDVVEAGAKNLGI